MLIDNKQLKDINKNKIDELALVGHSNDYNDLDDKPTEYNPSPHEHDRFMSKEDKTKLEDLKSFETIQVENQADTTQMKPNSIDTQLTIEVGEGIDIHTDIINNKLVISVSLGEVSGLEQGPPGDKGEQGDVFRPNIDYESNLYWEKNKNETVPQGFNVIGNKGLTGDKGPQGDKGLTGDKGLKGYEGEQGLKGPNGTIIGDKGPQGDKGLDGLRGNPGLEGVNGDKGVVGDKGMKGFVGQQGYAGEAPVWDLLEGKPTGTIGEAYYIDSSMNIAPKFQFTTGVFVENNTELTQAKNNPLNRTIYDLEKNQVWTMVNNSNWVLDSNKSMYKDIGIGVLMYNPDTCKLYFSKNDETAIRINIDLEN